MNENINGTHNGKSQKKKVRFNFIDLILIILAIALIAALVYIFSPVSWIKNMLLNHERTIQYTVEFQNVDEAFLDFIKENDVVGDSVTKGTIGTVTAVDYSGKYSEYKLVEVQQEIDGQVVTEYVGKMVEYPDKYNIIVTITVVADYTENEGYFVDSTRIAVGEKLSLKFPNYIGSGYCIGLNETWL